MHQSRGSAASEAGFQGRRGFPLIERSAAARRRRQKTIKPTFQTVNTLFRCVRAGFLGGGSGLLPFPPVPPPVPCLLWAIYLPVVGLFSRSLDIKRKPLKRGIFMRPDPGKGAGFSLFSRLSREKQGAFRLRAAPYEFADGRLGRADQASEKRGQRGRGPTHAHSRLASRFLPQFAGGSGQGSISAERMSS
jgi:hypothetical protein